MPGVESMPREGSMPGGENMPGGESMPGVENMHGRKAGEVEGSDGGKVEGNEGVVTSEGMEDESEGSVALHKRMVLEGDETDMAVPEEVEDGGSKARAADMELESSKADVFLDKPGNVKGCVADTQEMGELEGMKGEVDGEMGLEAGVPEV